MTEFKSVPEHSRESVPRATPERKSETEASKSPKETSIPIQSEPVRAENLKPANVSVATAAPPLASDELKKIESVLEEGMKEFFLSLSPERQDDFQRTGEATAAKIMNLIHHGKYRIKEIVALIVGWLRSLPGINKFFVEQEAKIKADRIAKLYAGGNNANK